MHLAGKDHWLTAGGMSTKHSSREMYSDCKNMQNDTAETAVTVLNYDQQQLFNYDDKENNLA